MKTNIFTHNLGFPRIGAKRELKQALESYWAGNSSEEALLSTAKAIRRRNWELQKSLGLGLIPSNDFSLYDHVLDTSVLVGAVPKRFHWQGGPMDLRTYFALARGSSAGTNSQTQAAPALEMTKWFDTNYHYLVPEFQQGQQFQLASTKPLDEYAEARALGIETVPVLLGPISFLLLGKAAGSETLNPVQLLPGLLPVYERLLQQLNGLGAGWVQLDEPVLATDLSDEAQACFAPAYQRLRTAAGSTRFMLAVYFGALGANLATALRLPLDGLHLDVVRGRDELERVLNGLPSGVSLSCGLVDGRNIWRNDFADSLKLLRRALHRLGPDRLMVAPSCSLLHVPVSLNAEERLDPELKSWLAFAEQKLQELTALAHLLEGRGSLVKLAENQAILQSRRHSRRIHNAEVQARCQAVTDQDAQRLSPYPLRAEAQAAALRLPDFPTTTIGSFPQTAAIRAARAKLKRGELTPAEYEHFLQQEIHTCIQRQEEIGLDVLVHGEFERNDMVEYFGEQLAGFAFTQNGWVQSYGSRCVKPPILFGDVCRLQPITVRWAKFAQDLTTRPVKGMLTGPITMLQWSFVRDDQPRQHTAQQLALALRDEVLALQTAGIRIIQIDEPALREGLPLRQADRPAYLKWAAFAFRLAAGGANDSTQIHTHMCYSQFDDILEAVADLDADVISFETSRSNMDLLQAFTQFNYRAAIGPGIWDIHSPRVPATSEMLQRLKAAAHVIPRERLWVNPDCGLKTRNWAEVIPALQNLVAAARTLRHPTPDIAPASGLLPIFLMQKHNETKSSIKPNTQSRRSYSCCGSQVEPGEPTEAPHELLQQGVLDVRLLPPARRHALIFGAYEGLQPGGSFVLVNDHDPKPLYYQFAYEKAGAFSWQYEEQGPLVWRVRIGKTDVRNALQSPAQTVASSH